MRALAAAAVAIGIAACRAPSSSDSPAPASSASAPAPIERLEYDASVSVYALEMTLVDQDGARSGLDVFRGHPVVVAMFYGQCRATCPLLVSTIKQALARLDDAEREGVRVLLVSFDPEYDTPDALRAHFDRHSLDARWKLATASEDQVRDLAAVLDVRYHRLPGGGFTHTAPIVLLDQGGAVAARADDIDKPIEPLVGAMRAMSGR